MSQKSSKKQRNLQKTRNANPIPHQQTQVQVQTQEVFSGPLPHPEVLRQYEDLYPGTAERIIKMAENQSAHRQGCEKKAIDTTARESLIGQISGMVISVGVLGLAAWMVAKGQTLEGVVAICAGLVSVLGSSYLTRPKNK